MPQATPGRYSRGAFLKGSRPAHRQTARKQCRAPKTRHSTQRDRCSPGFTAVSNSAKPVAARLRWSRSIYKPITSSTPPEKPANMPGPRAMPRSRGIKAPAFL